MNAVERLGLTASVAGLLLCLGVLVSELLAPSRWWWWLQDEGTGMTLTALAVGLAIRAGAEVTERAAGRG